MAAASTSADSPPSGAAAPAAAAAGPAAAAGRTPISALLIGTGEYTTGFGKETSKSDKATGVVLPSILQMRKEGLIGDVALAGTNGGKFPEVRKHVQRVLGDAYPASEFDLSIETFPADDVTDPKAYVQALDALPRGSIVTIFTPDDTHFAIAMDAVTRGMHVLVTKPAVKTLEEHQALHRAAEEAKVLVAVEVHKRWDPIYQDARDRLRGLGDMSYLSAYMSQPKRQLRTFGAWAGRSSDISYYLNSHHVDFSEWAFEGIARPVQVTATAATGVGAELLGRAVEDTITLTVQWENLESGNHAIAVYTASWASPPADVHSQQRFFAMCHKGEVTVDQAHRGYTTATDAAGFASLNPLFWKPTPSNGKFVGQGGYGYRSIESFVEAVHAVRAGKSKPADFDGSLATLGTTFQTTAVLEAGRHSLDDAGRPYRLVYAGARTSKDVAATRPIRIEPAF
ncbi:hypothetical protein FNF29_05737 [Cafeteria roenbergensis]|uniref:Uncharacterized protein n=1 Tax=Cafeteria roenbergensis TaxID=33653 RepID=A0A5A8C9C1_CAFRO|nr:hypothetical protein FNF29_05737 [Cafeteria roenbergensis]|eukprot:KAA0149726.1 hypothetical protein FNF29_05737 [Cafeteria roenbergensis]